MVAAVEEDRPSDVGHPCSLSISYESVFHELDQGCKR